MQNSPIILASGSPSRKNLLASVGLSFEVAPQDIDETPLKNEDPRPYVLRLATNKAASAHKHYPDALIIAADTIVFKSHTILQKPETKDEAEAMITMLSGTQHRVYTGLCIQNSNKTSRKSFVTRVKFKRLTPHTIKSYVQSELWRGVSGGYSLTSPALAFVKNINGSISSVMGLPLAEVCSTLNSFGAKNDF